MAANMNCEVVAVGTELLLGQIVDTNSSWIGERLAEAGIDSFHQTKVGDNFGRMFAVISQAVERSDAVIVCGGLGPTHDDITREVLAAVMGAELVINEAAADRIRSIFTDRGREMPENNLRQALVPAGAEVSPMIPGTAPGLCCPVGAGGGGGAGPKSEAAGVPEAEVGAKSEPDTPAPKVIYAVPGVPWEMKVLMEEWVMPDLAKRAGITQVIKSRTLHTWGDSESGLAEKLAGDIARLDESGHATIAFLASVQDGLKVRITAKASSAEAAQEILDAEEQTIRKSMLPGSVFGIDGETMEAAVLKLCRQMGETLATAESLTGGMVAAKLASVPGASDVFKGGIVSYAPEVKFNMLGVPEGPVVSVAAAEQMALGACETLGATCAVATTGVAGPDPLEGHPPGTVCIATAIGGKVESMKAELPFAREQVQQFTTLTALNNLRRRLEGG